MSLDRLKAAAKSLQALDPLHLYRCLYRAKVIAQAGGTVDARPIDSRVPDMAGIPLRHGIPGLTVQVQPGCTVMVGWEDGKPDRPFAALWSTDAAAVQVVVDGASIALGGNAVDFAFKGTSAATALATVIGAIGTGMGALLQPQAAAACAAFVSALPGLLSVKVRVE